MNIEESVERYFNKFNEVLKLVEEKCVNGNEDFATTLNENVYWNSKYLQKIFGYIADISLKDYVRRRRLTEAFYAMEDFTTEKMGQKVNGIANAKRKIIQEFGERPEKLQLYIYEEVNEKILKSRLKWKLENKLTKRKIINSDKLVLYSPNKTKQEYDWDKTYFMCEDKYFGIKGTNLGEVTTKDKWLSKILGKEVYIVTSKHKPVSQIVHDVYDVLNGESVSAEKAMNLLFMAEADDSFRYINLVTEVKIKNGKISHIQTDKMLKIEHNNLVLDISRLSEEGSA